MEIKDDIISRLNEELIKKESQMRVEVSIMNFLMII